MASIRKRTWCTAGGEERTAWVVDYLDQHNKRRLKTFTTKKAADAWKTDALYEVKQGIHTPEHRSITVAEAARRWIERCEANGLEPSTIAQYRNHSDYHIVPLIGREKLARLTRPRVEQFRDDLLKSRSPAMAKKVLSSLKSVLRHANEVGLVAQNVAHEVRIKNGNGRHKRRPEAGVEIPTKAEVKALLEAAPSRWRPFIVTAVFTGLRASELRGLTWDHVDFHKRAIRVRQRADRWGKIGSPKSASSRRDVPMAPMVANALREWRLVCPRNRDGELVYVFPSGTGKVESLGNITARCWYPLQRTAGIVDGEGKAKYGLHALRHFFASWLIDEGFGPKRVQALLGHSSITMTFDVYGHLFPQEDDHDKFAAGELALVG